MVSTRFRPSTRTRHIDKLIRDMGDLSGSMLSGSTSALLNSDNALAQRVISDDAIMTPSSASSTTAPSR